MPKPSIFNDPDCRTLLARFDALTDDRRPLWGTMNSAQMLDHLNKYLELVQGREKTKPVGNAFTAFIARTIFLTNYKFPKNVRTAPELIPASAIGELARLRVELHRLMAETIAQAKRDGRLPKNPLFGRMSNRQYGYIIWKHLDHHARQFGL